MHLDDTMTRSRSQGAQSRPRDDATVLISLDEQAREAWTAVVHPYRFVKVSDYVIQRWASILGASRTLLLLAFRQLAFVSRSDEAFGEMTTQVTYSRLAKWSGLSVGAVHKLLAEPGYLTWFVRGIGETLRPDGKPLTNRDRRTYHVRIDIPLTPQDQLRLSAHLEDRLPSDDEGWLRTLHDAVAAKKKALDPNTPLPTEPRSIQQIVKELRSPGQPLPPDVDSACVELYEQWVGSNFGRATHYFLQLWVPEMPPGLACLILWARRRAYAESDEAEVKHLRLRDEGDLAAAIGVSKKTVQRWRKRDLTALFLTFVDEYEGYGTLEAIDSASIAVDGHTLALPGSQPLPGYLQEGDFVRVKASSKAGEPYVLQSIEPVNERIEAPRFQPSGVLIEVRMADPIHPGDWERYTRLLRLPEGQPSQDLSTAGFPPLGDSKTPEGTGVNIDGTKVNELETEMDVRTGAQIAGTKEDNLGTKVNVLETKINDAETEVNAVRPEVNALRGLKSHPEVSQGSGQEPPPQRPRRHDGISEAQREVVVASRQEDWDIAAILAQGAVPQRDRRRVTAIWPERWREFIGWLLFGLAQDSIRYPVLHAVRRLLAGEIPPQEYLELGRTHPATLKRWIGDFAGDASPGHRGLLSALRSKDANRRLSELGAFGPSIEGPTLHGAGEGAPSLDLASDVGRDVIVPPTGKMAYELWRAAVDHLQTEMPRAPFETWVRDTELLAFQDRAFVVGAHNAYARDWLDDRLKATASRVLTGIVGYPVEVQFVVAHDV